MEEYVVLNNCGEDCGYEQESVMLSKDRAIAHCIMCQNMWPENRYYVARIMPQQEIEEVQKLRTTGPARH